MHEASRVLWCARCARVRMLTAAPSAMADIMRSVAARSWTTEESR